VIAVEGNHDTSIYGDHVSWMEYLSCKGFLKLLQTRYHNGKANVTGWNEEKKKGAFLDMDGIRFYGLGYLGASSGKKLELFGDAIEPAEFSVALLHAGIDMFNDMDMGVVAKEDVEKLRGKIDYVALGHIHKRYHEGGWLYNPGGLENWKVEECLKSKGYNIVDVKGGGMTVVEKDGIRRPGHILEVNMEELSNDSEVLASVKSAVLDAAIDPAMEPIISVKLTGKAKFDLMMLDVVGIRTWVMNTTGAAECLINNQTSFGKTVVGPGPSDRQQVESEVIGSLVDGIGLGLEDLTQQEKVDLVLRYKALALQPAATRMDDLRELLTVSHEHREGA
jgi:DNA repair exonuclease SbcCD nuclease subunit